MVTKWEVFLLRWDARELNWISLRIRPGPPESKWMQLASGPEELLAGGWEPFSFTPPDYSCEMTWAFRRPWVEGAR